MMPFVLLFILVHEVSAVTHSMKYFDTGSSQVPNFPEFVVVGLVDEVQMLYCDSNTKKVEPKQDWMKKYTEDYPQHLEGETNICAAIQQKFKADIETTKQRFNQTGGVHVYQRMYGCEWDDETDEVTGYHQYGYDGEDFITFNMETETWIAPRPEAVITKHEQNNDRSYIARMQHYHTHYCPNLLKRYLSYGRSSLMRKDVPSVSFLQKTPSSPVSCHATGFYPDRAMMFWRKDGEEIHEGVEHGEILPNHDGSFQMNVDLDISSVSPEDWRRYDCVFHLSGVEDDIITKLDESSIKTNWGKSDDGGKPTDMTTIIIVVVTACGVLAVILIAVIGVKLYKKKNGTKTSPDAPTGGVKTAGSQSPSTSDDSSLRSEGTDTPLVKVSVNGSDEIVQSDTPLIKDSDNSSDH